MALRQNRGINAASPLYLLIDGQKGANSIGSIKDAFQAFALDFNIENGVQRDSSGTLQGAIGVSCSTPVVIAPQTPSLQSFLWNATFLNQYIKKIQFIVAAPGKPGSVEPLMTFTFGNCRIVSCYEGFYQTETGAFVSREDDNEKFEMTRLDDRSDYCCGFEIECNHFNVTYSVIQSTGAKSGQVIADFNIGGHHKKR